MQHEPHPPRTDPATHKPASAPALATTARRAAARRIDCGDDSSHDGELEPRPPARSEGDLPRASQ